jgi:predicted nucleic acid-binding protein
MAVKIFLDANIILDAYLHRENYQHAHKIMEQISAGNIEGRITSSVLHICSYWLKKEYGLAETKRLLIQLLMHIRVIDIAHDTALFALQSEMKDVEDALQYYTAVQHKLDYFISSDKKFSKVTSQTLPILTPKEFLKELPI